MNEIQRLRKILEYFDLAKEFDTWFSNWFQPLASPVPLIGINSREVGS